MNKAKVARKGNGVVRNQKCAWTVKDLQKKFADKRVGGGGR